MKKHFNSKGFTLIEILLSLAILSIVIVPISSFFLASQKVSKDSDVEFKSITLAQNYFEMIKSMDFEMIESIDGIEWVGAFDPSIAINGKKNDGDYKIEINIKPVDEYKKKGDSVETEESNDYILYEVNIKVYNKDEDNLIDDKIITDINGYKSIY